MSEPEPLGFIQPVGQYEQWITIPLNAYQLGNLVDAISQAEHNGDWYGEFLQLVWRAMQKINVTELTCNRGRTFTLEQIYRYDIL